MCRNAIDFLKRGNLLNSFIKSNNLPVDISGIFLVDICDSCQMFLKVSFQSLRIFCLSFYKD